MIVPMGEDAGAHARDRAAELRRRGGELAAGRPVTPEDVVRARQHADESRDRAGRAHLAAAEHHDQAARAHRSAAATHEQAMVMGVGDDATHQSAAERHRNAAEADEHAAARARQAALDEHTEHT